MRIGILGHGFIEWGGGLDFLRMVSGSLFASGEAVELHALLPLQGPQIRARSTLRVLRQRLRRGATAHASAAEMTPDHIRGVLAQVGGPAHMHLIDSGFFAIRRASRRLALDVLLPSFQMLPPAGDLPWVGYVYDFQHKHLPQNFTQQECEARDASFTRMLRAAPAVVVNARAVAEDIACFAPEASASVFALPFSAAPEPHWFDLDVLATQLRYHVSGRYFIVCNQFWKHKDHATAFEAFAAIAAEVPDTTLVCTGALIDHRDPGYFEALIERARTLGIASRINVLGLIPKNDQIALLRGALALVQPTRFEGGPGGGAVYDAVSLGVPSIVSDIAVNREIAEMGVSFFRSADAAELAAAMRTRLGLQAPAAAKPERLLAEGRRRRAACGAVLLQAIDAAKRGMTGGRS